MGLLPPVPNSIQECALYEVLASKDTSSHGLVDRVLAFVNAATPLLDSVIAGPFAHYTLHNPQHARKLVHIAGHIISEQTLQRCTVLDCALLIQACYLHDLGLALSASERDEILGSDDFQTTIQSWPELTAELEVARSAVPQATSVGERLRAEEVVFQLHEVALVTYLRPRHAIRSRYAALLQLLKSASQRPDLCHLRGVPFEDPLMLICESHNLDVGCLVESKGPYEERFPRRLAIGGEYSNIQFVAALLRLADILDFDRERTPRALFENLGIRSSLLPGASVSLAEWDKHMAVHSIDLAAHEIVISARSEHPAIEKTIREFSAAIEREVRDTLAVLRRNTADVVDVYSCSLPVSVRPSVTSNGYLYRDLSFRLDETSVMTLLMGHRLYPNTFVPVRELLQNGIDACRVKGVLGASRDDLTVTVKSRNDSEGNCWIDVTDNGVGMDEYVLSEFFFRIGKQYYASSHFRTLVGAEAVQRFTPIARFGIGVASVFMIADVIQVETQAFASTRGDLERKNLTISSGGGLAFMTERARAESGTIVSIRLKRDIAIQGDDFLRALAQYLIRTVVRPALPVRMEVGGVQATLNGQSIATLQPGASAILAELGVCAAIIDLGKHSVSVRGRVILFFFEDGQGRLTHLKPLSAARGGVVRARILSDVLSGSRSNRLTVNGFTMGAKRLGRIFRFLSANLPVVVDCDVAGDDALQYDVAREKLIGVSAVKIRRQVRDAVLRGIQLDPAWPRLAPETEAIFRLILDKGEEPNVPLVIDPQLVDRVHSLLPRSQWLGKSDVLLPRSQWPENIDTEIAESLGISLREVWRAINSLLDGNTK